MAKTILILVANPIDTPKLRVNQEVEEIKSVLTHASCADKFIIEMNLAVCPNNFPKTLLKYRPNIVHIIGHGKGEDGIKLEDEKGMTHLVSTEKLVGIFKLVESVECVFLNLCHSIVQAKAISQHVNYVIGMQEQIGDTTAKAFAKNFYDALGKNNTYEFAFNFAYQAADFEGLSGADIPKLLIQPKRQLIDSEKLSDIKFILANVEGSWTNEDLRNICLRCIPDHSSLPNCRDETNLLQCLLDGLAKKLISSSGHVPILEFVARLSSSVPTHQKMLQAWIDEVGKSLGIDPNYRDELLKKQAVVETAPTSLPQYLLIELAPTPTKNSKDYTVQAWLFTCSETIRNIYTAEQAKTLEGMPELIDEILDIVCDFKVSHQLMIEFILPRNLLSHNIEHWLAESDEPIGIHYPVVVRSRERLREKRLQRSWCHCWKEANKKGVLQQMAKTCEVQAETQMDEIPLRKLTAKLDKGKIFFVFSSMPKMVTSSKKDVKKDVFLILTRWGMPIALLPRHINSDNEFKQVLSILRSCSLEHLPQRVFEIRRKLWQNGKEQHTGYHLSLLWDDPDRIPEFPRLSGPN